MGGSSSSSSSSSPPVSTMSNSQSALLRQKIQKEISDIEKYPPARWKLHNPRTNHWSVWITTGIQTPYHSIPFQVTVDIPEDYPNSFPKIKVTQHDRFFHPNINIKDGQICEKTLKKIQNGLTIRQRIDAFVTLLAIPNPDSALNNEAAVMLRDDYNKYYKYALHKFRRLPC